MKGTKNFPGCRGQPQQLGESMMGGAVVMAAVSMTRSPWGSTSRGHASFTNTATYPHVSEYELLYVTSPILFTPILAITEMRRFIKVSEFTLILIKNLTLTF